MKPTIKWTMKRTMWFLTPTVGCSLGLGCGAASPGPSGDEATSEVADPAPAGGLDLADRRDPRPPQLAVSWHPTNFSADAAVFSSELTLTNRGGGALATGWHLYFNSVHFIRPEGERDGDLVQDLAAQGLRVTRGDAAASGDYFVLEPLASFAPIGPGQSRVVTLLADNWGILKTDAPAGFHLAFDGQATAVAVPATITTDAADPRQTTRFPGDVMPVVTPASRLADNPARQALSLADHLLPAPRHVAPGAGQLVLSGDVAIVRPRALAGEAAYLAAALDNVVGGSVACRSDEPGDRRTTVIRLSLDSRLTVDGAGAEAYALDIAGGQIAIRGSDAAGVFDAIQTLRQLVPVSAVVAGRQRDVALPEVHITDAPGFAYRGLHLDVARHFHSKAEVEKLLDIMASYKLNKFHFHLADDEGWRLEIPGIPELTAFGAHRGFDVDQVGMLHVGFGDGNNLASGDHITGKAATPAAANGGAAPIWQGFETASVNFVGEGSGFYTTRDFEEILAFAAERHIEVIPEFDAPGHARAAVQAMEERFQLLRRSNPRKAAEFRLLDPDDTSAHTSVQGYTDNFMNPCLDSTFAFLSTVVREVAARYRAAGVPLTTFHAGGDELPSLSNNVWWQGSPLCKANPATASMTDTDLFNRFFTTYRQIITATGAAMTGWDDIINGGLALPGFLPMPWSNVWGWGREDDAYRYANAGSKVILAHATNLYLDLAYEKDPEEPGYYWANFVDEKKTFQYTPFDIYANGTEDRMGNAIAPATWDTKIHLTAAGKPNIIGMQGHLWGENAKSEELLEYQAFPKVLGVAERAWNPEPSEAPTSPAAWARFANRLGQDVLPRLGAFRPVDLHGQLPHVNGVNYRIPPPGAVVSNGTLSANVRYPGLAIEYSVDNGASWHAYSAPVQVTGTVLLRTRVPDGRTSRFSRVH